MRVFLVGDDVVAGGAHRLGQVAVQVQLGAHDRARSDQRAHPRQDVALAVVLAVVLLPLLLVVRAALRVIHRVS